MITQKIYATDIEDRIDPHFYKHKYLEVATRLKKLKTPTKRVDSFSNIICGPFGSAIKVNDYTENGVPLIRIENIDKTDGVSSTNVTFIKEKLASSLKNYKVKTGDLVISQRGTLGLSGVIRDYLDGAVISANLIAIKNLREVNPDYLQFFFSSNLGQLQLERRTSGQVQTKITTEDIKALLVPIPSKEIQQKIINLFLNAIKDRKEKLKQADELLNSIDGYVRQQLGIDYTEPEEEKLYTVNSQDLEDNRQDPYYHNPKFAITIKQLKLGKYPIEILGKYITEIRYGASVKNDYVDEGIPLLRILNLKPNHIDLTDIVHLPPTKSKAIGNCYVYKDDLLISRSGTIGIVAVVPKEADGFAYGSFMIKFRLNDELDSNYASVWLNSDISKLLVQRERIGAIQGNITIPTIQSFLLPIPSLDKQKEIANGVMEKYREVENLKNEASKLLENAKKKVEEMILN